MKHLVELTLAGGAALATILVTPRPTLTGVMVGPSSSFAQSGTAGGTGIATSGAPGASGRPRGHANTSAGARGGADTSASLRGSAGTLGDTHGSVGPSVGGHGNAGAGLDVGVGSADGSVGTGPAVGAGRGVGLDGPGIGPSRGIDPGDNVGARRGLDASGAMGSARPGMILPRGTPRRPQDNSDQLGLPGLATDNNNSTGGDLGTLGGVGAGLNGR